MVLLFLLFRCFLAASKFPCFAASIFSVFSWGVNILFFRCFLAASIFSVFCGVDVVLVCMAL